MKSKKHTLTITIECPSSEAALDILNKIRAATDDSLGDADVELEPTNAAKPTQVIERYIQTSWPYTPRPWFGNPPNITWRSTDYSPSSKTYSNAENFTYSITADIT